MATPTNAVTDPTLIRYARRLAHDLNNFTTVVRTYSELVLADLPPDSPSRSDVEEIQRAAEGMVTYLQRVTRFARAGMMKRVAVPVDESLEEVAAQFRERQPARPLEVSGRTEARVAADPLWFRDVLAELLQNAHEAAPAGGAVRVVCAASERLITITVHDGGGGVSGDAAELFAPFATNKQGVRGAGHGLALALAFAAACDGDLALARNGDETVATLTLPRADLP